MMGEGRGIGRFGMTRREKLIERMRRSPGSVRFSEIEALLRYEGFVLFNARGSHCLYHHADGRFVAIVRPHGGRTHCHPSDVQKLLEVLRP
jgi:predicted RNA binding protein YcfA (HicA-like mRNA interferase family)